MRSGSIRYMAAEPPQSRGTGRVPFREWRCQSRGRGLTHSAGRLRSDAQRLRHQPVEMMNRMLADLGALTVDDEAALHVALGVQATLHRFAEIVEIGRAHV